MTDENLWLALEHDVRAELKHRIMGESKATSIAAAEREVDAHPDYRAAVSRMREAERMVALAEARQEHARLRALAAMPR